MRVVIFCFHSKNAYDLLQFLCTKRRRGLIRLNEGIQQIVGDGCVHADGNSKLRGTFFHQAIMGMKPETNTSQVTAFEEVVVMPMRWQQGEVSKLNNVENK